MQVIKGMVQVLGTTYRIARVEHNQYQVTRIWDDAFVGAFDCGQTVQVTATLIERDLMRRIACAAVQQGRTSWMGPAVSLTAAYANAANTANSQPLELGVRHSTG